LFCAFDAVAFNGPPPKCDNVWFVFVAVAAALITNCVPFVIDAIVAPAGIPVPLIAIPAAKPAVLATVTVVPPLVVDIDAT
jgi:hypothetical protein